jgi:hypothetical protein
VAVSHRSPVNSRRLPVVSRQLGRVRDGETHCRTSSWKWRWRWTWADSSRRWASRTSTVWAGDGFMSRSGRGEGRGRGEHSSVDKKARRWRTASYVVPANRQLECQGRQGWGNVYLAHSTTKRVVPVRGWRLRLWLQPPTALNVIPAHQRRCPQLFAADKLSRPLSVGAVPPGTGLLA